MNETQLKTFLAITEYRSYSKVAVLLNITQPTVTSRIKSLEKELKCKLFRRVGHDILLTNEGYLFVEYARNILTYIEHSKEITNRTKKPKIKVGFSPGYSYSFIVELLNTIKPINSENIQVIEGYDSISLNDKILTGDIDLIFTREILSKSNEIISEYLFENTLVAIIPSDHYLSQQEKVLLEDLNGETIISFRRDTALWNMIDKQLMGAQNLKRVDLDNNEMVKQAVANQLGVGIIPSLGINKTYDKNLITKNIKEITNIPNKVYVQYRRSSQIQAVAKKIIYSVINHKYATTLL